MWGVVQTYFQESLTRHGFSRFVDSSRSLYLCCYSVYKHAYFVICSQSEVGYS